MTNPLAIPEGGNPASPRIVALGGGHGLYATLSAARRLTAHVTAVVTVADDGGSSGRLQRYCGIRLGDGKSTGRFGSVAW